MRRLILWSNTVLFTEDGPEKDVPHFHVDRDDIIGLLRGFDLEKVVHTEYCFQNGASAGVGKYHYYVSARRK